MAMAISQRENNVNPLIEIEKIIDELIGIMSAPSKQSTGQK